MAMGSLIMEEKCVFSLLAAFLVFEIFLVTFKMGHIPSLQTINKILNFHPSPMINQSFQETNTSPPPPPPLPRFAYSISGSKGDLEKLWRTLHAVYHPRNQYVVHLDLESRVEERMELESRVQKHPLFSKVGNVFMITKADMVTYRGPTWVAHILHACAILLKRSQDWDWFINLSASDYPLVTQDG